MNRSYLLLLALLLVGLIVATAVAETLAVCGDVNSDGGVDIADASYTLGYLIQVYTAPDFAADADDYYLLTIRDVACLTQYIFAGGATPTCPPSHGKYIPVFNSAFNLTYSAVFPANETQYTFDIGFQRDFDEWVSAIDIPLLVRIDGEAPANLSASQYPGVGVRVNPAGAPNGSLLITGWQPPLADGGEWPVHIAHVHVTMPTSSPNPRPITLQWIEIPPIQDGVPVNYPMIVDEHLDGWVPALNGIEGGEVVGFYALYTRVSAGTPVFFTGTSTVEVSDWLWDFGDPLSGDNTSTLQNPIHTYSSTGAYTVTLEVIFAGGGNQIITRMDYIHVNPVKAAFTASPRYGSLDINPGGLPVQFTDASTSATSWLWNFGDPASGGDNTSALQSPTHTYANAGVYTVELIASNPGSSDTKIYLNCIRVDAVATPDLQVSCYGPDAARRGFHKELDIVVTNVGSADASGATLTLDLSQLPAGVEFGGSVPPPKESEPYPTIVTWELPPITWDPTQLHFDDYLVRADLYIDPGVDVGKDIPAVASVSPAAGEVILTNNTFADNETVVAAIDPNDKSVQPPGCGLQRAIKGTERLNYLIQFENKPSATAAAFYVLVVDTLDPNLDWGTLQIGPSSKDNVLTFDFDPVSGEMVWLFNGYELPPNITPPEGEGFVSFSISPKLGLAEGALIRNRAHIRFDFESWLAAPEAGPLQLSISSRDDNHNGIIDACEFICGDANGDGAVDISDAVYLIAYIFSGGSAPDPLAAGDANCDSAVDISDVVYLIAYIFSGGQPPCAACK